MKKALTLSLVLSSALFGVGYQIPNNSVNSNALATAYVANANGADAAYFNPAKMVYNDNAHEIEIGALYVLLSSINYNSISSPLDIQSEKEEAFIPSFHYTSPKLTSYDIRLGFSVVVPAGLTRQWKDFPASVSAEKFSLQTTEFNPSIAIPINDKLSVGFGLRYVIAEGEVMLDGSRLGPRAFTVDMNGKESSAFGYNLAISYQATDALNISATYRSKIELDLQGDASTTLVGTPISSGVSLQTPIPANFIFAAAYTFSTDTTVELTYDRTMWSSVKETNFNYDNPVLEAVLGKSSPKKWHDTSAYRMGITQKLDEFTLMCGIGYSTNPATDEYVSFSSPESDTMTYSVGTKYAINEDMEIGLAVLYSPNKSRTVYQPTNPLGVNGTLSNKKAYTISTGLSYKF